MSQTRSNDHRGSHGTANQALQQTGAGLSTMTGIQPDLWAGQSARVGCNIFRGCRQIIAGRRRIVRKSLIQGSPRREVAVRRRFLIVVGVLALFCAGVGSGMFVQHWFQIGVAAAAAQPALDFARAFSAEGGQSGPAPALEHWRYPGAIDHGSGRGSGLAINGKVVTPAPEYLVLATADDYEKVAAYYGSKLGFVAAGEIGISGMTNKTSTESGFQLALADGKDPGRGSEARPVRVLCLRQTCASYSAVAFITRAENEAHTHVILLCDPKVISSSPPR